MQQRGIGGRPHPDVLVARIADHGEIVVALHGRLAKPLQLDLDKPDLLVDQPPERIERQVGGALALVPVADRAHGAAEIAAADILDIELDRDSNRPPRRGGVTPDSARNWRGIPANGTAPARARARKPPVRLPARAPAARAAPLAIMKRSWCRRPQLAAFARWARRLRGLPACSLARRVPQPAREAERPQPLLRVIMKRPFDSGNAIRSQSLQPAR